MSLSIYNNRMVRVTSGLLGQVGGWLGCLWKGLGLVMTALWTHLAQLIRISHKKAKRPKTFLGQALSRQKSTFRGRKRKWNYRLRDFCCATFNWFASRNLSILFHQQFHVFTVIILLLVYVVVTLSKVEMECLHCNNFSVYTLRMLSHILLSAYPYTIKMLSHFFGSTTLLEFCPIFYKGSTIKFYFIQWLHFFLVPYF